MKTASTSTILAAAVMIAAALVTASPPAQAAGCARWGFDGPYEVDGGNGWWINFSATGTEPRTSATVHFIDGGKVDGTIIGGGISGRDLNLTIVWGDKPNNVWELHGTVSDDGFVRDGGESLRNIPADYGGEVASSWKSRGALKCLDAAAPAGGGAGQSAPQEQAPPPPPPQNVKCPQGSSVPEVPPGGTCPAPKDAIRVTFTRAIASQWTVNVTNSADLGGNCTYNATSNNGTPGTSNNFTIGPKGTANFKVPPPAPFTTYHVVTSCTGDFGGQPVEFGHDEQDVSL